AERSAEKRGEAQPEYGAHVAVPRRAENSLVEATYRLVHHCEQRSLLHLLSGVVHLLSLREEIVDRFVHALFLPGRVVLVEALPALTSRAPIREHRAQRLGRPDAI